VTLARAVASEMGRIEAPPFRFPHIWFTTNACRPHISLMLDMSCTPTQARDLLRRDYIVIPIQGKGRR